MTANTSLEELSEILTKFGISPESNQGKCYLQYLKKLAEEGIKPGEPSIPASSIKKEDKGAPLKELGGDRYIED